MRWLPVYTVVVAIFGDFTGFFLTAVPDQPTQKQEKVAVMSSSIDVDIVLRRIAIRPFHQSRLVFSSDVPVLFQVDFRPSSCAKEFRRGD